MIKNWAETEQKLSRNWVKTWRNYYLNLTLSFLFYITKGVISSYGPDFESLLGPFFFFSLYIPTNIFLPNFEVHFDSVLVHFDTHFWSCFDTFSWQYLLNFCLDFALFLLNLDKFFLNLCSFLAEFLLNGICHIPLDYLA